jgi:hypothetical protein
MTTELAQATAHQLASPYELQREISSRYLENMQETLDGFGNDLYGQYEYLMNSFHGIGMLRKAASNVMMMVLWEIKKRGLWTLPDRITGEMLYSGPDGFSRWVEDNIIEQNQDDKLGLSNRFIQDLVRSLAIADYIHINPIILDNSNVPLKPEDLLVADNRIKAMKLLNSQFTRRVDDVKVVVPDTTRTPLRDKIVRDLMTERASDVIKKYGPKKEIIKLPYSVQNEPDGRVSVCFENLSMTQFESLRNLMGEAGEEIGL